MVATCKAEEAAIARLLAKLAGGKCTLPQKYRILTSLRNCSNASAGEALVLALQDSSALFRHDVAFALGQRQDDASVEALKAIVEDKHEHCMVRHEAAEALGAIGAESCKEYLERYENDAVREVAETCQLARQRLEFASTAQSELADTSRFMSVDPTPPFASNVPLAELESIILDEDSVLFNRYRALFSLRNRGGSDAVDILARTFSTSSSVLLKHEVAYVFGQMMDKRSIDCLKTVLQDAGESAIVRHEAAEALGAIADEECVKLLKEYSVCDEPIVADSCIVALDMIDFERSGAFEYADLGDA